MTEMKCIPLNIVMTYPVHWNRYQVLRDFVQNFYDSVGYEAWAQRFHYEYQNNSIYMWINGISFSYEWLMHIGASTKTANSNEYAGYFGEGFKIASLCAYRDIGWKIQMQSDNWQLEVCSCEKSIDHTIVEMLSYNVTYKEQKEEARLIIGNISLDDYQLFLSVLDSFFYQENPIMGQLIWKGEAGAVFQRSKNKINRNLPATSEFGRKGAVFCGYQMLGTSPFDLVVCLHRYKKNDRERRGLYTFEVIGIFEDMCRYIDSKCAMAMLEKMRRYWNSYPHKKIDIKSWSRVVDRLIRKIAVSPEIQEAFVTKYNNLLCLERIYSISERNKRSQARSWLAQQNKHYVLVKDTFMELGYPTIEMECEQQGGFVVDDAANEVQDQCFFVLENVCKTLFNEFFLIDNWPERKIITNKKAAYHGMAVVYKKKKILYNVMGMAIRYDVGKIYLKSDIFKPGGYYDAVSTYVHELCHIFGGDASVSFSQALTHTIEILMENNAFIIEGRKEWEKILGKPEGKVG